MGRPGHGFHFLALVGQLVLEQPHEELLQGLQLGSVHLVPYLLLSSLLSNVILPPGRTPCLQHLLTCLLPHCPILHDCHQLLEQEGPVPGVLLAQMAHLGNSSGGWQQH